MKKTIFLVLLAVMMLATSLVQFGAITAEAATDENAIATTQYTVKNTNKPTIIVEKGFALKQQKSHADRALKTMNMLPSAILKKLKNVKIYIVKDANDYYSKSEKVRAFYMPGSKKIYITSANLINKFVLLHELGHAFDYISGNKSQTSEFKKIYNAEKSSSSFQKTNLREYFADAFANYTLGLTYSSFAKLFDKIPKTKDYIKKVTKMGDLKK